MVCTLLGVREGGKVEGPAVGYRDGLSEGGRLGILDGLGLGDLDGGGVGFGVGSCHTGRQQPKSSGKCSIRLLLWIMPRKRRIGNTAYRSGLWNRGAEGGHLRWVEGWEERGDLHQNKP